MKDKGHFYISLAKSIIRILNGVSALGSLYYGVFCSPILNILIYIAISIATIAIGIVLAEVLGILEEVYDKR